MRENRTYGLTRGWDGFYVRPALLYWHFFILDVSEISQLWKYDIIYVLLLKAKYIREILNIRFGKALYCGYSNLFSGTDFPLPDFPNILLSNT